MSIFDPYDFKKGNSSDNADRNQLDEATIVSLLSMFGITTPNDFNLGQLTFKDSYIDPATITGNTAPVMVAWQGQLWVKPVGSQAYPVTQSANGLVQKINTVLPEPLNGVLLLKSSDGSVKITDDILAHSIDISISDVISKVNKNTADILNKLENIESASTEIIANKSGVKSTLTFVPTSAATNLVSTDPQNWLHLGSDGKLSVTSGKSGRVVEKINNINPDNSNNFEIKNTDDKIDISDGVESLILNINDNKIVDGIISSDSHNNLVKGVDDKLFVEKSIKTINGVESNSTKNILFESSDGSITFSATSNNAIDCKAVTGGGTLDSLNNITGQTNINIVAGSNITITKQGATGSEEIKIDSSGGGTGVGDDYSFNNAKYVAETPGTTPTGSYKEPYAFKDHLQDALDSIGTGGIIKIIPKNSNVPISPTTGSSPLKIEHKELKIIDIPTGIVNTGFDIDLSSDTSAYYHDIFINLEELSRLNGPVIVYSPSNSSTSLDNESFLRIKVDTMRTSDNLELFKLDGSKTITSATKKLYVNLEINNLICPSSSTNPTKPIIDLTRGSITNLDSIIVNMVIGSAQLNPVIPSTLHNLILGKGAKDSISIDMLGNKHSDMPKHIDLSNSDRIFISGGIVRSNEIFSTKNLVLPKFATDALASAVPVGEGSLYYNTTSLKVKKFDGSHWVSLTGASVADEPIPDSIYYDDNNISTINPDGSISKPFKLLADAIGAASVKSKTDNKVWTVRAKDGSSRENSETLVFGGAGKHLSVNLDIPYIILKGDVHIDLSSDVDHNLNTAYINVYKLDKVKISTINPIAIPVANNAEIGVFINIRAKEKIIISNKESFVCDLSSLTTTGTKLKKEFVSYLEVIDKITEIYDYATQVNSIFFDISDELRDSTLRAECKIKGINEDKSKSISRLNYISFTAPTNIDDSISRLVLVSDLGTNGTVYDYVSSNGSTSESYFTSMKITSTDLEAKSFKALNSSIEKEEISKTLLPPTTKTGVVDEVHSVGVDINNDSLYFVNSKNKKILLGASGSHSKINGTRFAAFGDIKSSFIFKEINTPSLYLETLKDTGEPEGHVIDILPTSINLRFEDIVYGGKTYEKQKPIDSFDYTKGNYYGVLFFKLSNISKFGTTDIFTDSSTSDEVKTKITFNMPNNLSSNIIEGNTITIKNPGSDKSVEAIVRKKTVVTDKVELEVYSNIGHGDALPNSDFKPLADIAAANAEAFTEIYLGDKFGFDFSKGVFDPKTNNKEFCVPYYYPVLFQDEDVLSRNAIVLIGHSARFGSPSDDTPGKRSFCKKHIPPILLSLKKVWGAQHVAYQQLSVGISAGIINNATFNTDNGYRQIQEFYCSFYGPHWEMKYIYGGNAATKISMFNPKNMYGTKGIWTTTVPSKTEFIGGSVYLSSFAQDDTSINLLRVATTKLDASVRKNLKIANSLSGNIFIDTEFGLSGTDIIVPNILGLGDPTALPELTLYNINLKADADLEVILAYKKGYVMIRKELESVVKLGEPSPVVVPVSIEDFSDLSTFQTAENKNIQMLP